MIGFAKFVNFVLALVVFGALRVATAELGNAAWAVSLVVAIIIFYIQRAMLVLPLLKRAINKASTQIIQHFAGGGEMGGAINVLVRKNRTATRSWSRNGGSAGRCLRNSPP